MIMAGRLYAVGPSLGAAVVSGKGDTQNVDGRDEPGHDKIKTRSASPRRQSLQVESMAL
jgi:hypothetical protein